jgi:hypothetical protein
VLNCSPTAKLVQNKKELAAVVILTAAEAVCFNNCKIGSEQKRVQLFFYFCSAVICSNC